MIKYHKQGVQYLAPVTITDNKEIALSVSDEEFDNNKLEYRDRSGGAYWAVFRPTFKYKGKKVTDRVLVVKSETKLRTDRKSREKAIKKIEERLIHIESRLNTRKYNNQDYVKYMAKNRLREAERRNISLTM